MTEKTISDMVGRTVIGVVQSVDEITFHFADGCGVKFYHEQYCCEAVLVEDVNGEWSDLYGVPLLVADERVSHNEVDREDIDAGDSVTWTFYTFRTINGSVDVRWLGASNGYYSESVDMDWMEADE